MVTTCVMVYLGGWLLTAAGAFVAGRMLAEPDGPADNPLLMSLAAGAVWPLVLLGVVELSSVAVYTTAQSRRTPPSVPESWLRVNTANAVSPLL